MDTSNLIRPAFTAAMIFAAVPSCFAQTQQDPPTPRDLFRAEGAKYCAVLAQDRQLPIAAWLALDKSRDLARTAIMDKDSDGFAAYVAGSQIVAELLANGIQGDRTNYISCKTTVAEDAETIFTSALPHAYEFVTKDGYASSAAKEFCAGNALPGEQYDPYLTRSRAMSLVVEVRKPDAMGKALYDSEAELMMPKISGGKDNENYKKCLANITGYMKDNGITVRFEP